MKNWYRIEFDDLAATINKHQLKVYVFINYPISERLWADFLWPFGTTKEPMQ